MTDPAVPGSQQWLDLVVEEVVDPHQRIVDPHHHLWPAGGPLPYGPAELNADLGAGHRVERTVFVECGAAYRTDGPEHLAPVGETEFVASVATSGASPAIAGIVAHADLRRADLGDVLDAHQEAGQGLFRGIRHALSRGQGIDGLRIPGHAPEGLSEDESFREGVAELGRRDLTYDTWHYHFQADEFLALARAVPGTVMVLDHFGTPLGVGHFADQRDEIFERWKADMVELARCDNVVAKLGGLAMPDNGYGWHQAERPPTSDELVVAQGRYYRHMIETFRPDRCMFESNFPVDRWSLSYVVFWNAAKKMSADLSPSERDSLFDRTATRVYRL